MCKFGDDSIWRHCQITGKKTKNCSYSNSLFYLIIAQGLRVTSFMLGYSIKLVSKWNSELKNMQHVSTTLSLSSNFLSISYLVWKEWKQFLSFSKQRARLHFMHFILKYAWQFLHLSFLINSFLAMTNLVVPYIVTWRWYDFSFAWRCIGNATALRFWWSTSLIWCWSFVCMHQYLSQFVCNLTKCKHLVVW